MNKTVITYGTFDLFHIGHLRLLQRLKALGNRVIVGVSTDEFNLGKGKKCLIPYDQRTEIVSNFRQVDMVIPESSWEQKEQDIVTYGVDIFAMGSDWKGRFDYLEEYCEVVYLERTEGVSTTEIKNMLSTLDSQRIHEIQKALEVVYLLAKEFE